MTESIKDILLANSVKATAEEIDREWLTAIDRAVAQQGLRCGNCEELKDQHVAGKCLFEATDFRPMTDEEMRTYFLSPKGGGWKSYQTTGIGIGNTRSVNKIRFK
jgi:hypothetical protein